ncbi:MAG: hypothetical protein QM541_16165, partial [Flavobacterium sp.]|nr:hypothetical protein [Flavobacterium sp.]
NVTMLEGFANKTQSKSLPFFVMLKNSLPRFSGKHLPAAKQPLPLHDKAEHPKILIILIQTRKGQGVPNIRADASPKSGGLFVSMTIKPSPKIGAGSSSA